MKKNKSIIEIILIISILFLMGMLFFDDWNYKKIKKDTNNMIKEIDENIETNKKTNEEYKENCKEENKEIKTKEECTLKKGINISGCLVFGKIRIDKIGIEYPIIEYVNEKSLLKSICKISNNDITGTGNLCLAGHNMRNNSMFSNLKKVNIDDIIVITNMNGEIFYYKVYEKQYVDPEQIEVLKDNDESIITLITCNNSLSKRLIIKGKINK